VWLYGRTILTESSDSQAQGRPDLIGVSLLILTMGSLALAIVQGNDWGWRDPRMVSAFAAAALSGLLCGWRSTHHPLPILDLSLFRIRSFTIANLATLLFTCAFFAGLLGNVLFLTTAWRYTLMQAGLALTPAPLCAVVAGAAAAHIATSQGHRAVILPGIVVFSVGFLLMMQLGAKPAFLSHWLPINILLGTGVGLALPTLSSASAIFLPAARFAVGSAVFSTARQFGAVIGVAMLIAILGTPTPAKLIESFHHAYGFCLIAAIAVGILCLALEQPGALTA